MAITISLMSIIWSQIFGLDWRTYLPYIIFGMVTWMWISSYVTQAPDIYSGEFVGLLKAKPISPVLLACRFVIRGFIMYIHYVPIFLVTMFITSSAPSISSLFFIPFGIIFILLNAVFITIYLGIMGARFRDIPPLITAVMAPMMLMTPVLWRPSDLGSWEIIAYVNPFTHFISIIRSPMIGESVQMTTIYFIIIFTIINGLISIFVWNKFRYKLVFWI